MRPHAFGLQGISSKGRVRSTLVVAPLLSALASPIGCPACGRCSEACKALFPMLGIECEESLTHGIGAHWQWDLMKAKCDPDDQVRQPRPVPRGVQRPAGSRFLGGRPPRPRVRGDGCPEASALASQLRRWQPARPLPSPASCGAGSPRGQRAFLHRPKA
ncbi:unnamed protein product [Prorocentrum cordatum]|uniref:4Fe-4S ferredoxin-type domain-containing protein n=1 Tax=Prorocentrum cordatum TaxID=2364126 RepID=A0ABN9W0A7_9DINO|nr:unnamed protein product [Polarella glacialis]